MEIMNSFLSIRMMKEFTKARLSGCKNMNILDMLFKRNGEFHKHFRF